MARYIGAHTRDTGGIHQAVLRAHNAGMTAIQMFTAIPKYYGDRSGIRPERVERFRKALSETAIAPEHVVVHAAYVLNCASADETKWTRAMAGLAKEMERSSALGVGAICFHPGAATDGDRDGAIARVGAAMIQALRSCPEGTRLLVENTAGAGLTIGKTPEEIGAILSCIPSELRSRTGYGLDTCHLYAAGHDLTQSAEALSGILDAFEQEAGEPPSFFHLNDSQGALGSNRDRHALLGEGEIGTEPFRWLLTDRRSQDIPLILETPQSPSEQEEDDLAPDEWDVRMMELLRDME